MASLNTMFIENANATFNNTVFNCRMITGMNKSAKEISEQMQRLYQAAKELKGIEGKSDVARLLNLLPQHLNNWESGRPISAEGLLTAQQHIGCDAVWLRDGTGDMRRGGTSNSVELTDLIQLTTLYSQSTDNGRRLIMRTAKSTAKRMPGAVTILPTENNS
jgi:hypothetical protein